MSGIKGLARRPDGSPTVLLQGRVSPETRERVHDAAARSGISIAYYLDILVGRLVEEQGSLPTVSKPARPSRPTQEALPEVS